MKTALSWLPQFRATMNSIDGVYYFKAYNVDFN